MRTKAIDLEMGEVLNSDSSETVLLISCLRMNGGTQSRAMLDAGVIRDYAAAMCDGETFPAVSVIFDGTNYWLWDGFHRVHAALDCGYTKLPCEVEQGTQRDAILKACGANPTHGLRRTNADKRRAVLTLLNDNEWGKWSDREISKRCSVSPNTVGQRRQEFSLSDSDSEERTYTTKHGTVAIMNTAQIGKSDPQFKPAVPKDAPIHVTDAVDFGVTAPTQAVAITRKLKTVTGWTHDVTNRYGVLDVDTLDILERLYSEGADSCTEIEATGFIQPGEDYEAVHIASSAKAVSDALRLKAKIHAQLDADEKPLKLMETDVIILGMSEEADEPCVLRIEIYLDNLKDFEKLKGQSVHMILKGLST